MRNLSEEVGVYGITSPLIYLSADNSTVVWQSGDANGVSRGSTQIWTESSTTTLLSSPTTSYLSISGINEDGTTVIGRSRRPQGDPGGTPAYWSKAAGLIDLPVQPGFGSSASHVSSDGSVIAGSYLIDDSVLNDQVAYRWSSEGGITILSDGLTGDFTPSWMSADGNTIIGDGPQGVWKWTVGSDLSYIVPAPPAGDRVISDAGEILAVVGENENSSGVFRWTPANGFQELPKILGFAIYELEGFSGDGKTILGRGGNSPDDAFYWLWNDVVGILRLDQLLFEQGLQDALAGWSLRPADAGLRISSDGNALVGSVRNPDGYRESVVIYLDPIAVPEPSSMLLGTLALAGVGLLRWRGRSCVEDCPKGAYS